MSDLIQKAHELALQRIPTYKEKFEQGPEVFILWYRKERQHNELPYPHEVYPELQSNLEFYDHPAWKAELL